LFPAWWREVDNRSLYGFFAVVDEGMTVPVFYDASKPERSVVLDCSLTKVVVS